MKNKEEEERHPPLISTESVLRRNPLGLCVFSRLIHVVTVPDPPDHRLFCRKTILLVVLGSIQSHLGLKRRHPNVIVTALSLEMDSTASSTSTVRSGCCWW